MKNIKKIFSYVVVGALVIALSISCKSNEEPTVDNTHSNHPPTGEYKGQTYLYDVNGAITSDKVDTTINFTSSDTCNIKGTAYNTATNTQYYDITITKWSGSTDYSGGNVIMFDGQNSGYGEAVINSPTGTTDFRVNFYSDTYTSRHSIYVSFKLNGKVYQASGELKQ